MLRYKIRYGVKHILYNSRSIGGMDKPAYHAHDLLQDKQQLIESITKLLTDLLSQTQNIPREPTPFDCKKIPAITIREYLRRISKYSNCSSSVLVAALIYIDRFQERIQNFIINYYNIHRLLISCVMVGAKYLDDFYYKNEFYARIGGITKVETNNLELKIMETFDFRLFIEEEEFNSYLTRIETYKDVNA